MIGSILTVIEECCGHIHVNSCSLVAMPSCVDADSGFRSHGVDIVESLGGGINHLARFLIKMIATIRVDGWKSTVEAEIIEIVVIVLPHHFLIGRCRIYRLARPRHRAGGRPSGRGD